VTLARGHEFYGWFNPNPRCGEIDFAPADLVETCFAIVAVEYKKAICRMRALPEEWNPCPGGGQ
jgi:hypothetical protein